MKLTRKHNTVQTVKATFAILGAVAEANIEAPHRLGCQKTVELGHRLHLGQGDAEAIGNKPHDGPGDMPELALHLAEHLHA